MVYREGGYSDAIGNTYWYLQLRHGDSTSCEKDKKD